MYVHVCMYRYVVCGTGSPFGDRAQLEPSRGPVTVLGAQLGLLIYLINLNTNNYLDYFILLSQRPSTHVLSV